MEIKDEDFDAVVRKKLNSLNDSYPSTLPDTNLLWEDIENTLDSQQRKYLPTYALPIAASVSVLLMAFLWWLYSGQTTDSYVVYRIETLTEAPADVAFETDLQEKQALKLIEIQCQTQQAICQSKVFLELKAELDRLYTEEQEVAKQRQLYGPSPALIKAETRLENYKTYLLRELIETMKS
jgi:hypothetical protein